MSGVESIIEAMALNLVLRGRLEAPTLEPLVAELRASAAAAWNLDEELGELVSILGEQPVGPDAYARFSAVLERVRAKVTAGGAAGDAAAVPAAVARAAAATEAAGSLRYDASNGPDIMNHFFLETAAHLQAVEEAALHLEGNPRDAEALNAAFRAFHSLKGVTGFLDLAAARELVHQAEALIEIARRRAEGILPAECDRVLRTVDLGRTMVDRVREHAAHPAGPFPALPAGYAALLQELKESTAPVAAGGAPAAMLAAVAPAPAGAAGSPAAPVSGHPPAPSTNEGSPPESGLHLAGAAGAAGDPQGTVRFQRRETDQTSAALVRVQVEKLDRLIDAIGELAITQIQIFQNGKLAAIEDEALARNVALAGKVTRELQTLAMTLRMVPLRETFGRMTRLARDIAHREGKEVAVVIEGEDTEMDKSLIELLLDPLTHLVRNAIDHGVGTPEERERAGKPRRATLKLSARSQGGFVMVEVSDDGQGLDLPKIQARARQRGLLREGETADPVRLQQFIFEPGFSTAERVTDLSGRGIGLDVVRSKAASVGGRVAVTSAPGRSTAFTITLPLTLAIIDGLIVCCGRQEFILPLTLVVESLRPLRSQLGTVHERGQTVELRGHSYPLVRLAEYARVKDARRDPCESIVIMVDSRGEQYALQVDEILGVQQVVIKNLGDRLHGMKGISGGAILGDGRVRLILDVVGILAQNRSLPWQAAG